ncbi:protein-tyrosine phosphatase [Metarhizium brunneum]
MFLKSLVTLLGAAVAVQSLPAGESANELEKIASNAGFQRFKYVTEHVRDGDRLSRSSAPNYVWKDSDQNLTADSIKFLQQQEITHVISLNHEANNENITTALQNVGIAYTPLPIVDFGTPTLEDFQKGYEGFKNHRPGTLVWCGFGHGRTGTMISALQIYIEHEKPSPQLLTRQDYDNNHVEEDAQRAILDKLQKVLQQQREEAAKAKPKPQPGSAEYNTQLLKEKCDASGNSPACMKAGNRCAARFAASEKIENFLNCVEKVQVCLDYYRQDECEEFAAQCQAELGTLSSNFYSMAECTCKKQGKAEGEALKFCVSEKAKL